MNRKQSFDFIYALERIITHMPIYKMNPFNNTVYHAVQNHHSTIRQALMAMNGYCGMFLCIVMWEYSYAINALTNSYIFG